MDDKKNFDRQKYIEALEDKGATNPCHRCGHNNFSVIDGYSYYPIQDTWKGTILGGPKIPAILVACNHCGAITPHALGAFEQIKEEQKGKEAQNG